MSVSPSRSIPPVVAASLLVALLVVPMMASGESIVAERDALPKGLSQSMVADHGGFIYVFGGSAEGTVSRDILRIDPKTLEATKVGNLPGPRAAGSAATIGERIYIFGGVSSAAGGAVPTNSIIEFVPATGNARQLPLVSLPSALFGTAAASDGEKAYIFGGYRLDPKPERRNTIIEFTPPGSGLMGGSGRADTLPQRLPHAVMDAAAAYDGDRFFIVGGLIGPGELTDKVVHFDARANQVRTSPVALPQPIRNAALVADDGVAHLFGGGTNAGLTKTTGAIIRIEADRAVPLVPTLEPARWSSGAVLIDGQAYVVGGALVNKGYSRAVVALDATPDDGSIATALPPEEESDELPDDGEVLPWRPDGGNGTGSSDPAESPALSALVVVATLLAIVLRRRA